jgi:pimeloyl-ACP methyl ester carboxylesterase
MRHRVFAILLLGMIATPPALAQVPAASWDNRIVVFIADGSGDSTTLSDNLSEVTGGRYGLILQRVPWCRYGSIRLDYKDEPAQLAAAAQLAHCAQVLRQNCPGCRIVFIGHSAGTRVVLAAAEMLPPAGVDRIILLSSSLAWSYDLSGALRASSGGIDNFYSTYDALVANTAELGTSEGIPTSAAGLIGFRWQPGAPHTELHANLRQYYWREGMRGQGGHYVWTLQANLRAWVLPLICSAPAPQPTFALPAAAQAR